jgi:hypothetical protein
MHHCVYHGHCICPVLGGGTTVATCRKTLHSVMWLPPGRNNTGTSAVCQPRSPFPRVANAVSQTVRQVCTCTFVTCVLALFCTQVNQPLTCSAAVHGSALAGLHATAAGSASCSTSRPTSQSARGLQHSRQAKLPLHRASAGAQVFGSMIRCYWAVGGLGC